MKFPEIPQLYSLFEKFPNVITDSRKCTAGTIFFSLKGENFDGNQFAASALEQGCNYAVIDNETYYKGEKYILVKDCLTTLQALAKYHREHLKIPFIAITGSNGKTTTKELIKDILSKKYKVLATTGNLNNHIGVPLTLLSITSNIEIAVIEMGANHIGEIAMLCDIAQPDYGLITNIGKAHLGEFGSFDAVVKTKTELYQYIRNKNGKIFINAENDLLISHSSGIDKITYGISEKAYCMCQLSDADPFLKVKYENEMISSQLIGKYNFENVAASICIGKYLGVDTRKIKEAIEEYVPSNNRSQVIKTKINTLILDAYNANPSSMRVAIENFYDMQGENKWLILGDMLELGEYEVEEHKNILQLIAEKNFKNIILVGNRFSKAMSEMNISSPRQLVCMNSDELINKLKSTSFFEFPSLILIKASRGIKLEKIVEYL
ncbi:MAG: UDP-N-acetylmuramoyl-tripeptide--D-alanyl-D-alanine ligase [Bacteroidetes bacterium]|nr:UDP-N-acetylmuramoyl-tripeptide--D-alanyl-D-alanine ligase [Bacteroidota bacterium]